jgi:hypothetical protein
VNKIEHAVLGLVREAEKGWVSGFLIMWWQAHEVPDQSRGVPEVRLFVSMAVRNPCRPQEIPKFKNEEEELDFALSNTYTKPFDDTAIRLLFTHFHCMPNMISTYSVPNFMFACFLAAK